MKIEIRESAYKDLKHIDRSAALKLLQDLQKLKDYPSVSNIKKLINHMYSHRMRLGNYRVLFDITNDTIFIGRILHRKDAYKD